VGRWAGRDGLGLAGQTGHFSPPKLSPTLARRSRCVMVVFVRSPQLRAASPVAATTPGDGDSQTPPLKAKPPRRPPPALQSS